MARQQQDLTLEAVAKMSTEDIAKLSTEDIAKLSKKIRRKANVMREEIAATKAAEARAEELRFANLEKERKRREGIEKKRLEKENQVRKDDERHRLMSKEVAKWSKTIASVMAIEKPTHKEELLPFHEALAKLLVDTSFRGSIPGHHLIMFDKLTSMPPSELAKILLQNGFSPEPPHRIDYIITEVLNRGHRGNLSRDFAFRTTKEYEMSLTKCSLEARMFTALAYIMFEADVKYSKAFFPPKLVGTSDLLDVMTSVKTFLVVNRIPWRETHLLDIIKAIEDPIGRIVRLGRAVYGDLPYVFHRKSVIAKNI